MEGTGLCTGRSSHVLAVPLATCLWLGACLLWITGCDNQGGAPDQVSPLTSADLSSIASALRHVLRTRSAWLADTYAVTPPPEESLDGEIVVTGPQSGRVGEWRVVLRPEGVVASWGRGIDVGAGIHETNWRFTLRKTGSGYEVVSQDGERYWQGGQP